MQNTQFNQTRLIDGDWDMLMTAINNENVVLVLGKELFSITDENGNNMLLTDYVMRQMAISLGLDPNDVTEFSELSYDDHRWKWNQLKSQPYQKACEILNNISDDDIHVPEDIRKLLATQKFKLVLTTTVNNMPLRLMEEVWGKGENNIQCKKYIPGTQKEDILDISLPTIYYMFGKACKIQNGYMLTDDDLLHYLHGWLNNGAHPKGLSNVLIDKYILFLGCNYADWLYRFFFYSLKFSKRGAYRDSVGMLADSKLDKQLVKFLDRMNAGAYGNTHEFLHELMTRWESYKEPTTRKEVFISYASEDYEIAKEIAATFTKLKMEPWFDKRDLHSGEEYAERIQEQIRNSSAIVVLLSHNSLDKNPRFFKREWKWAKDAEELNFPKEIIHPLLLENDINIDDPQLKLFRQKHALSLEGESTMEDVVRKIIREIRVKE